MLSRTRTPARSHIRSVAAAALALAVSAACSSSGFRPAPMTSGYSPTPDGKHFTFEAIRNTGATTAWQALERLGMSMYPRRSAGGEPASFGRARPAMRYQSPVSTLVVIDGFQVPDLRVLNDIAAGDIAMMHVLTPTRATILYGDYGWNGAIVIETFRRR